MAREEAGAGLAMGDTGQARIEVVGLGPEVLRGCGVGERGGEEWRRGNQHRRTNGGDGGIVVVMVGGNR